jgi:hypothetical protein
MRTTCSVCDFYMNQLDGNFEWLVELLTVY